MLRRWSSRSWRAAGDSLSIRTEQALENLARVGFLGDGSVVGFPGQVGGVGATVAGIATAGELAGFAAQLQRWEPRGQADLLRGELIDGDAQADVGPVGFFGVAAGEVDGHGAGVIAGAIAVGAGPGLREAADDEHVGLEGLQGGERGGSSKSAPSFLGVQSGMWMPLGT